MHTCFQDLIRSAPPERVLYFVHHSAFVSWTKALSHLPSRFIQSDETHVGLGTGCLPKFAFWVAL